MKAVNSTWSNLNHDDVLFFTIGHEPRSIYLYEKSQSTRQKNNTIAFRFDDRDSHLEFVSEISAKGISIVDCRYEDSQHVINTIKDIIVEKKREGKHARIHIDYSSMPRNWYCSIPLALKELLDENTSVFFWYNAGRYPQTHASYPSAAIESISVFSGISLPAVDIKRYHILGLGFDAIRTETVKTIIEPDGLLCCYAYNPNNEDIKKQIQEINARVVRSAALTVSVPLDNFGGILDKLSGLAYDLLLKGSQVIFVPDGPKPLIMAMSLIPELIHTPGVTCLHIASSTSYYPLINVEPRENEIFGFQIIQNKL